LKFFRFFFNKNARNTQSISALFVFKKFEKSFKNLLVRFGKKSNQEDLSGTLAQKIEKSSIVQETEDSETDLISQKGVTENLDSKADIFVKEGDISSLEIGDKFYNPIVFTLDFLPNWTHNNFLKFFRFFFNENARNKPRF
jgi:hypothetical protein